MSSLSRFGLGFDAMPASIEEKDQRVRTVLSEPVDIPTSRTSSAASSLDWFRATIDTCAPFLTRRTLKASPRPVLPPVTYACYEMSLVRTVISCNDNDTHQALGIPLFAE